LGRNCGKGERGRKSMAFGGKSGLEIEALEDWKVDPAERK